MFLLYLVYPVLTTMAYMKQESDAFLDMHQDDACFMNEYGVNNLQANHNILIVDDDDDIIECFKFIFECEGFKIDCAHSPEEALEKARDKKYVIAILDYILPNMRGDELAEKLSRIDDSINLIFISGYTDAEETITKKGISAYRFFMKPINPESLIDAIKSIAVEPHYTYTPVPQTFTII